VQSIIRLVLIDRTARARMAFDQTEGSDFERVDAEFRVLGQERTKAPASAQMHQLDVRNIRAGSAGSPICWSSPSILL